MIGTESEKLSDIDQHLFIEKGLRGGISYIAERYSKANKEYCPDYDPKKSSTFIPYLHTKNLYGWAMNEYLPYCTSEWLENMVNYDIMSINDKSPIGCFLEVDLQYPDNLLELHNDFPLAPKKLTVSNDMLSKHCKNIGDIYKTKVGDVKKINPQFGYQS